MQCTCSELRKAARAITQLYDSAVEPSGLLITQLAVLRTIANSGSETISHLAEKLEMDRTTLTRNLSPLEKKGLIKIHAGKDQRTRLVEITTKGRQAAEKAIPRWEEIQLQVIDQLGEARWRMLMDELSEVVRISREGIKIKKEKVTT